MIGAWRTGAPALARECAELWSLRLGEPYEHGYASLTLRADLSDDTPAVLKVGYPHPEAEREPDALLHYDGHGAVRLLAHDTDRNALLLERAEPGTPLWEVEDDKHATRIAADVLRRLWSRVAPPDHLFRVLAHEAPVWAEELRDAWARLGRPFESRLVDAMERLVAELSPHRRTSFSATRTSRGATSCVPSASPGSRSTRSRSSASRPSTSRRCCATGAGTSAPA